eukprot:Em0016g391a
MGCLASRSVNMVHPISSESNLPGTVAQAPTSVEGRTGDERPVGRAGVRRGIADGGVASHSNKGQLQNRFPDRGEGVSLPNTPLPPPPRLFSMPRTATESQVEFFKMLDKKIEEGPDYVEK